MKLLATFAAFTAAATAAAVPEVFPAGSAVLEARNAVPGGGRGRGHGHHHKDKWGCNLPDYRHKVTIRASQNETDDVSDDFLWAMHKANHGGTVWLKEGETYVIGKKLLLDFLKDIHVQLDGEILFTDDIEYWQANNFYYDFQRSITFWVWGGEDIRIYGSGTLNGNAQRWWAEFQGREVLDDDNTFYRPILFLTDNATRVDISGINFLNSPIWFNLLVRSKDVSYDNVYINAVSSNASVEPANSDGWDTLNTDGVSITNSRVNVGDDCYSAKPNSSNIFLQNLWCNGTHGISMGS
ncbi:glycoside hydrolase family 28 protein, partial [Hortaea werneckii]